MKQYVIDQIRPDDQHRLKAYLDQQYTASAIDGVYWVPLKPALFKPIQAQHTQCQPFYFAFELANGQLSCELLVRTQQRIRCGCMQYADSAQRDWLINLLDRILDELHIKL